jgi:hypothetical protein
VAGKDVETSAVALRPLESGDADSIFEMMRDVESVQRVAFTLDDPPIGRHSMHGLPESFPIRGSFIG